MSRNVDALAVILWGMEWDGDAHKFAAKLAAEGVLAVNAITDAAAANLVEVDVESRSVFSYNTADEFRAALRRCATGEDE